MVKRIRLYGEKPYRVAVVHGGPGAPGSVAAIARELSRDYGVMEPLQTRTTLEGQVEELREVLGANGMPPVTLIGHSWGAWLALILAARYPSLVRKLVLVSSAPFEARYVAQLRERRLSRLSPTEQARFDELLHRLESAATTDKSQLLAGLEALVAKTDNFDAVTIPTDEADAVPVDGDQYQGVWSEASTLRKSGALLAMVGRLTCPIVAIHGDSDPHPPAGVREPLERVSRNFRFHLLEQCGHSPWKERHARDEFYRALREEI